MSGAVAANLHEGSRSEILADYLFSGWGTVTPVRRQDDFGIDLFCTLTERVGQRAAVTGYYSVQIKSTDDPWVIGGDEAIRWLVDYPTPLFLAVVDKKAGAMAVYRTTARFMAGFWPHQGKLALKPSRSDEGDHVQWRDPTQFDLSAPILRVTLQDLLAPEKLAHLRAVFDFWVRNDELNCMLRRMGLLRVREPQKYFTNVVPSDSAIVEQGMQLPTTDQQLQSIKTLVEVVDCVGHQMLAQGDRQAALYACALLRHLRQTKGDVFDDDLRWPRDRPWSMEFEAARMLDVMLDRRPQYALESLDAAMKFINLPAVAGMLGQRPDQ